MIKCDTSDFPSTSSDQSCDVIPGNKQSDAYWKDKLTSKQYYVCRQQGTDQPFNNAYYNNEEDGIYACICCGQSKPLFLSKRTYNSNSGWPSFTAPIDSNAVAYREDNFSCMRPIEVICSDCHSHLGHVFDDGPPQKVNVFV